mmetsp:Transcript_217/g.597  ORF Transcript_217/g.597 Transcript_217/m.597 type:complete len:392 (-) Transcript_217:10-1185(-)
MEAHAPPTAVRTFPQRLRPRPVSSDAPVARLSGAVEMLCWETCRSAPPLALGVRGEEPQEEEHDGKHSKGRVLALVDLHPALASLSRGGELLEDGGVLGFFLHPCLRRVRLLPRDRLVVRGRSHDGRLALHAVDRGDDREEPVEVVGVRDDLGVELEVVERHPARDEHSHHPPLAEEEPREDDERARLVQPGGERALVDRAVLRHPRAPPLVGGGGFHHARLALDQRVEDHVDRHLAHGHRVELRHALAERRGEPLVRERERGQVLLHRHALRQVVPLRVLVPLERAALRHRVDAARGGRGEGGALAPLVDGAPAPQHVCDLEESARLRLPELRAAVDLGGGGHRGRGGAAGRRERQGEGGVEAERRGWREDGGGGGGGEERQRHGFPKRN